MNVRKWSIVTIAVVLAMLAVVVGLTQAQGPDSPEGEVAVEGEVSAAANVAQRIPIQGRLTDTGGNPLNGTYSIRFRLYGAASGGTVVCEDTNSVSVEDGQFYSDISGTCDSGDVGGQQLYLGVKVGSDPEMSPLQPIFPVPYAWSLRPGAEIKGEVDDDPILYAYNTGTGPGVWATSLEDEGIHGSSWDGSGVYGSSLTGTGVHADSLTGAAITADGTGIIRSAAKSYVWISGNDLRKKHSTDTTHFECDTYGGVKVRRGADSGTKDVMLPVTLPGQLYGQDVTLTGIDVYFESQGDFDGIGVTAVRRQSGAGSGDLIRWDGTDRVCSPACSYHLDLTSNNVLDDQHGIVYVGLQLFFGGSSSYVQIGGVRLTLEHD
ncbi:MAG: hypothetical protein PVG71_12065 [Anaerolineae bacterium]|jgi:hypothetical protein